MLGINADNFGPVVTALLAVIALILQLSSMIRTRQRQTREIEMALDHQPEIRQQLELGNFGEAIKHLNEIIVTQARHIDRQDEIIKEQGDEIEILKEENRVLKEKSLLQAGQLDRSSERIAILSDQLRELRRRNGY